MSMTFIDFAIFNQELVVKHFKDVVNNQLEGEDFSSFTHQNAFTDKFHQKIYFVKPISNVSKIDITWCLGPILKVKSIYEPKAKPIQ